MDDVALRERRDGSVSALLMVGVRNMVLRCGCIGQPYALTFEMTCEPANFSKV
jgi:hypothetical protein